MKILNQMNEMDYSTRLSAMKKGVQRREVALLNWSIAIEFYNKKLKKRVFELWLNRRCKTGEEQQINRWRKLLLRSLERNNQRLLSSIFPFENNFADKDDQNAHDSRVMYNLFLMGSQISKLTAQSEGVKHSFFNSAFESEFASSNHVLRTNAVDMNNKNEYSLLLLAKKGETFRKNMVYSRTIAELVKIKHLVILFREYVKIRTEKLKYDVLHKVVLFARKDNVYTRNTLEFIEVVNYSDSRIRRLKRLEMIFLTRKNTRIEFSFLNKLKACKKYFADIESKELFWHKDVKRKLLNHILYTGMLLEKCKLLAQNNRSAVCKELFLHVRHECLQTKKMLLKYHEKKTRAIFYLALTKWREEHACLKNIENKWHVWYLRHTMNILICRLRCGSQIRVQHIATSNAYYKSTNIYTQRVKSYTNGLRKHAFSVWLKAFDDIKRLGSDRNYVSNGIQGYLAYKRSQYNNQDLCGRASYHNNVLVNEKSSHIYGSYEPLGVTYKENARKKSSESKIANNVLMVDDHADLHAHCVLNTNGNTNSCDLQKTTHSLVEEPALLNLVSETNKTGGCSTQGVEVSPPAPRIFSEMPQHFRVHSDSLSEETLRINNKLLPTKNSSPSLMRPELSKRIFFSDTALYDFGVSDIWNNLRYNRQLQAGDSSKSMFRYTSKQPVSDMTSGAQDKRGSGSNFAENLSGDLIRRLDEFAESIATRLKVNAFKKLVILDRAIKTADSHYFRKKTEQAIKKLRLYSENVCINRIMDKTPKKLLSEVSVITNNGQKNHLDCDIKEKNENTHGQTSVYADRNTILDKLFENSTCGSSSKQFTEDSTESSLLETPNDEYTEQLFAIAMGLRAQLSSSLVYHYLSCLYQLYVECSNGLIQFGHVDKRNMLTNKSDRVNRTLLRCWRIWNRQHLKVTLGNTSGIVNGSIDKRSGHIESFTSNIEVYSGGEPLETKYPCAPCQNSTPINERSTYLESYTGSHGNSSFISNSSECLDPQRPSDFHLNWERAVNMYNTFLIVDVIVKLQDLKCMFDTHNRYD